MKTTPCTTLPRQEAKHMEHSAQTTFADLHTNKVKKPGQDWAGKIKQRQYLPFDYSKTQNHKEEFLQRRSKQKYNGTIAQELRKH